jgi:hypothetical protein
MRLAEIWFDSFAWIFAEVVVAGNQWDITVFEHARKHNELARQ